MFSSIQGKYVPGLVKETVSQCLDDISTKRLLKANLMLTNMRTKMISTGVVWNSGADLSLP